MISRGPYLGCNFSSICGGNYDVCQNEHIRFEVKVVVFVEIAYPKLLLYAHRVLVVALRNSFCQATVEGDAMRCRLTFAAFLEHFQ